MATDKEGDTVMADPEAKSEPSDLSMKDEANPAASNDTPTTGSGDEASEKKEEEPTGLTAEERVTTAEGCKEAGNTLLKSGDFAGAVLKYAEGTGEVESLLEKKESDIGEDLAQRRTVVYVALCLNSAQACIKQKKWTDASEHASKVLALEKDNAKALYRRGVASMELATDGRLEQARTDLAQFVQLEPANREARERLQQVKEQLKEVRQKEKERYSQAMKGGLYQDNHKKLDRQKLEYEEEVKRRADAGEDEISWEDWQKKLKDRVEDEKKKDKEEREKRAKELAEEEEQRQLTTENERRKAQGLEEMTLEDWRSSQEKNSPKKEEVVTMDTDDLDEEERKMLEETKNKGYYHGRLGTVLSNAAPKPQQLSEGDLRREPSPEVQDGSTNKGSEWNQAGTWEERDTTAWVKERLTSWLSAASVGSRNASLPSGEVTVSAKVSSVKSLSGEAQIVSVRSRKTFGYNYEAELSFRIKVEKQADEKMSADGGDDAADKDKESPNKDKDTQRFDGTLSIAELADFVQPEELRVEASWKGRAPPEHLKSTALDCLETLKKQVRVQVRGFVGEYHAH